MNIIFAKCVIIVTLALTQSLMLVPAIFSWLPQPIFKACRSYEAQPPKRRHPEGGSVWLLLERSAEDWTVVCAWNQRRCHRTHDASRNSHDDPCRPQKQLVQVLNALCRRRFHRVPDDCYLCWLRHDVQVNGC